MFKVEIKSKVSTRTILAKEFSTLVDAEMWVSKYKHLPKIYFHVTKDGVKVEL